MKALNKGAIVSVVFLVLIGGIFNTSIGFATSDTVRVELKETMLTIPPPTRPPQELGCVEYAIMNGATIEEAEEECDDEENIENSLCIGWKERLIELVEILALAPPEEIDIIKQDMEATQEEIRENCAVSVMIVPELIPQIPKDDVCMGVKRAVERIQLFYREVEKVVETEGIPEEDAPEIEEKLIQLKKELSDAEEKCKQAKDEIASLFNNLMAESAFKFKEASSFNNLTAESEFERGIIKMNKIAESYALGEIDEFTLHYEKSLMNYKDRDCDYRRWEETWGNPSLEELEENQRIFEKYESTVGKEILDDIKKGEDALEQSVELFYQRLLEESSPRGTLPPQEYLNDVNLDHLKRISDYAFTEEKNTIITYYSFNNPDRPVLVFVYFTTIHTPKRFYVVRSFTIYSAEELQGKEDRIYTSEVEASAVGPRGRTRKDEDVLGEAGALAAEEFKQRCISDAHDKLENFSSMNDEEKNIFVREELSELIYDSNLETDHISEPIEEDDEHLGTVEKLGNNIQYVIGHEDINIVSTTMIIDRENNTFNIYPKTLKGDYDTRIEIDSYFLVELKLLTETDASVFSVGAFVGKSVLSGKIKIKPIWRLARIISIIKFVDDDEFREFYSGVTSSGVRGTKGGEGRK